VAIALASWFPGLWRPIAIGGTLIGVLSFAAFWDGQVSPMVDEGVLGMVISLVILIGAIALPQVFS
jgi:hypothetical protein